MVFWTKQVKISEPLLISKLRLRQKKFCFIAERLATLANGDWRVLVRLR